MKISLGMNLQEGPFGGGNQFGRVLVEYLRARGVTVTFDLHDPDLDLIVLVEPRHSLKISAYTDLEIRWYTRHVNPRALVVHRINECDERKGSHGVNALLMAANTCADHTVFISAWLRDVFIGHGLQMPECSVILNGADPAVFHAEGSQTWDKRSPLKLVTHHWGTSWLKGFDIYQRLDHLLATDEYKDRLAFTYIGQLPPGFVFQNAAYLEPQHGAALADALRQQHVYITASQNEPAGMHHIEGALCGLPLLYRESGALPEYCAGFGLGFTAANFEAQLELMFTQYDAWRARMPHYAHTAEKMCTEYYRLFEDLVARRDEILARRPAPPQGSTAPKEHAWALSLNDSVYRYIESLRVEGGIGRYLPAAQGLTEAGRTIALGFSCFALKTYFMLGIWDELPAEQRAAWIAYLQDFQVQGNPEHLWVGRGAFLDPFLVTYIKGQVRSRERLLDRLLRPKRMTQLQRMISSETKQAIATLAQVGATARFPYHGFPTSLSAVHRYLEGFNWAQPWEAGAHLATLAVFLRTEAPRFLQDASVHSLLEACRRFTDALADPQTGGYFRHQLPDHSELINGAMKVLTALEWLETPIHYPEKLIDTCLSRLPQAEGCHLVDTVYVLHRCAQQTDHRRAAVQDTCRTLLGMIREHYNPEDGGFSYYIGRAQSHYQKVRITNFTAVSDLHGTVLLTWAVVMILDLLDQLPTGWQTIKP